MSYPSVRNKKIKIYIYILVALGVLSFRSLPKNAYDNIRSNFVSLHAKLFPKIKPAPYSDLANLELENLILKERVAALEGKLAFYKVSNHTPSLFPEILTPYFHNLVEGRVIYRDYAHWSSSCWVNIGKSHGIRKNSPVLSGKVLVGLVDYVGENQSRIRLITDVGMKPSVVAMRGKIQVLWIKDSLNELITQVEELSHAYILEKDKYEKIILLKELDSLIQGEQENQILSRGILSGIGGAFWREGSLSLEGEGFCSSEGKSLLPGDILVTTGLDGIFPPGLLVARVTKVKAPRDGACTFKIEAQPLERNMMELSRLFILPPLEFNPNDRPDIFGLLWD
ncbi:rod shape-determining protein MreC,rod shape-determining protein MreC,rod shape-determining protein MreC [Chlamydia serpentis]|uniref:Cell shape-determining protein MreC n=1 Tax=Chlamydia serpentis TaxID=1967782 RepID=A0A2R8FC12_9CHLA|nr:rod shape-determining protein MreC [Chlamydia serpentis]SPN73856.1 rod shape-determining protein MreC,rod shape-determining protein MreC,rod shape-determining protein MreC [Chlamydia serpentis]